MSKNYALTVLDLRTGVTLLSPHWQSTWPALADLSALRASRPSWPDALAPDDASALLRAEIALLHKDGRAVLRQAWFGFLCESGEKIIWRELDEADSPSIIVIWADLSSACVWDQYGTAESLPALFPDITGLVELEERLERWAWLYDQAYAASNGVREKMHMGWDRFNSEGFQLAQEAKSRLGSRAVLFYEKAPFDATSEIEPSLLIE